MDSYTFPKTLKVRKNGEYKRLSQKGKRLFGTCLIADYLQGEKRKGPKMGITVSKKYGKAHERNRFKRYVREAFRLHQHLFPTHIAMNIRPQNKARQAITLEAVTSDLKKFFIPKSLPALPIPPELTLPLLKEAASLKTDI